MGARILVLQYFGHLVSDVFLLACALVMFALFFIDLYGLLANRYKFAQCRHISFATSIVSVGLFATFVGVLIGLYGFDAANISASVPKLLGGLRFAFAGSVLGMFLSLTLSIAQKILGETSEDEQVLHSIDRKLGSLVATIQTPGELVKQFTEMKVFLKDHLERINLSLDEALSQLARGATQEVIQALERIIQEFNQNLTSQFGDNFKELNTACYNLVEWQRKYKDHVDGAEAGLKLALISLDQSCVAAKDLTASNEKTQRVCQDVASLIKTYDLQIQTLETHLKSCRVLGEQAGSFLATTQSAISRSAESMNSFSGVIEASVGKQSESLARLTSDIDQQLPKALGELERVLTTITNQFAADYRSLFQFVTNKQ